MSSWEGKAGRVPRQADPGDWSDQDDVVQPSNESQRTAPPEESAAGHTVHVGEGVAAPSNHAPYDWPTLTSK
jgi:hypothetical protein